jgi:ABC-type multidrug transport system fused ATPase/permease subunit
VVERAAARAQLSAAVASMADGYLTDVGDRGSRLSGGERQRLALTRAHVQMEPTAEPTAEFPAAAQPGAQWGGVDERGEGSARSAQPDADGAAAAAPGGAERALVLLCDEPTSALDVLTEAAVLAELRACSERLCTLLVTHRLATCVHADEIIVLSGGTVAERGTHAELVHRPGGEYARMWRTQQMDDRRTDGELDRE